MLKCTISSAPHEMVLNAIKTMDFDEVDRLDAIASKQAIDLFYAIANKEYKIAYYDSANSNGRFLRYALHRSPKNKDCLQMSCMLYTQDGKMYPCSDQQYKIDDVRDLEECYWSLPSICNFTILD